MFLATIPVRDKYAFNQRHHIRITDTATAEILYSFLRFRPGSRLSGALTRMITAQNRAEFRFLFVCEIFPKVNGCQIEFNIHCEFFRHPLNNSNKIIALMTNTTGSL
jgi:hypothetical protein